MPEKPVDLYGTMGSVPSVAPDNPAGGPEQIHASPEAFGAQVGEARQALGEEGVKVGAQAMDLAIKRQGMINETLATNAGAQYEQELGTLKGQMMSKTGLEASAALPQFQADVEGLRQKYRSSLPGGAARAFDMYSVKSGGYAVADANSYAAGQIKAANYDSAKNGLSLAALMGNDPSVANSDERSGYQLGTIQAHAAQAADPVNEHVDPATGDFRDTPAAQAAKQHNQDLTTHYTGQFWENRIATQAATDPFTALKTYSDNKATIPPLNRANIEASLTPKIVDAYATGDATQIMGQSAKEHQDALLNPSSAGVSSNNLGNVKTAAGAAAGTAEFEQPATPADGALLTANTLRKGYQGLTVAQIGAKWAPSSENKTSDWVANVSKASGFSPDDKPDLNNPADLAAMMRGISVAEKSPADRAKFTDQILFQSAQNALQGATPQLSKSSPQPQIEGLKQDYLKNPDGSKVTLADWVSLHRMDLMNRAYEMAEQRAPGDLRMRQAYQERTTQLIDQTVQEQAVRYKQDNMMVQRAITGELSNGATSSRTT